MTTPTPPLDLTKPMQTREVPVSLLEECLGELLDMASDEHDGTADLRSRLMAAIHGDMKLVTPESDIPAGFESVDSRTKEGDRCKHLVRWPHECQDCRDEDDAEWSRLRAAGNIMPNRETGVCGVGG